jgi:hypothetical protein
MTLAPREIRIDRPDGTVETHRVEQSDGGYFNEFLNFSEAVANGAPVIGTVAQSYRNMAIVLGGIESAQTRRTRTIDPWPDPLSASAVPLWQVMDATNLFDGLLTTVTREIQPAR